MKKISNFILLTLYCLALVPTLSAWSAEEQGLLEDILFEAPSNTEERIIFKLNGTYLPKIFSIKGEKPRVVFDFPHTKSAAVLNNIIETNGKIIKSIRIGIHEGANPKTRVVLDLTEDQPVDFKQKFNENSQSLVVSVHHISETSQPEQKPAAAAPEVANGTPPATSAPDNPAGAAEGQGQPTDTTEPETHQSVADANNSPEAKENETNEAVQPPLLHSITFDANTNRGEMILFKLNDFYPPIVFGLEESSPRVVCDFMETKAEDAIPSVITCDGKFVKTIRVGRHTNPDKIRVVLDLTPNNNYDLQQVFFKEDNLFVIIINTLDNATL